MLEKTLNGTRKLSLWLTWIGGSLIILSAFMVTLEVFLRKVFNISLGGANELSGYAFGIATAFSLAYALFERAHIRVDALFNVMPKSLRPIVNFLGLILLLGFALVIVLTVWDMVGDTLKHGSRSNHADARPACITTNPLAAGLDVFHLQWCLVRACRAKTPFCR